MKQSSEHAHISRFFLRVLAALIVFNFGTATVLIYIAYTFNTASLTKHVRETIIQQVTSFSDDLNKQRFLRIKKTLKALENSPDLEDFLDSSEAQQLILARRIEKLFIQIQNDNSDISGLYFYNDLGLLQIAVQDKQRELISHFQNNDFIYSKEAANLFKRLNEMPLLLSSGNMEWFMPPREVEIIGPFTDKKEKHILLVGLSKLDKSTGLFNGMLLLRFNLNTWLDELAKIHIQNQSHVWVSANGGKILLQPESVESNATILFKTLPPEKYFKTQLIQSDQGIVAFRDISISEQGNSLRIAFVVPNKLLLHDFAPAIEFFSWILIFSVIVLAIFSYFISSFLVQPFNELAVARNKLVTAQSLAGLGHWDWDRMTKTMHISENAINILCLKKKNTNVTIDSFLGKVYFDDRKLLREKIIKAVNNNESSSIEFRLLLPDGTKKFINQVIDVTIDDQVRIIGTVQDISDRRRSEDRIKELAYHDSVTGLANRVLIHELAENALQAAHLKNRKLAIIFLDLDKFKLVNDTFGHDTGDHLLRQVALRLLDCVRPSDTVSTLPTQDEIEVEAVARIGGDEFIILLPNLLNKADAVMVARRIHDRMSQSFTVNTKQIHCAGSMGISVYPEHGTTIEVLLRNADAAMYFAKQQGRNRYEVYNPAIDALHQKKVFLENSLQRALHNNEFRLFYQPRYKMATDTIVSFEALIRWMHPEKGMVMPDEFIGIAEENGQINAIGQWVMETALKQLHEWQTTFDKNLGMSINLSPVQFLSGDLVSYIQNILSNFDIIPDCIELELTENALFKDVDAGVLIAEELKKLGVSLSIDDFGTGYSSLKLLRQFPIDTLKIDQSFVQDILTDHDDALIVESSIILGQNLGLKIVAEGVTEQGQWDALYKLGCDEVQGYFKSKPLSSKKITELLLKNQNNLASRLSENRSRSEEKPF